MACVVHSARCADIGYFRWDTYVQPLTLHLIFGLPYPRSAIKLSRCLKNLPRSLFRTFFCRAGTFGNQSLCISPSAVVYGVLSLELSSVSWFGVINRVTIVVKQSLWVDPIVVFSGS